MEEIEVGLDAGEEPYLLASELIVVIMLVFAVNVTIVLDVFGLYTILSSSTLDSTS